jgi:hypothetical protein
LSFLPEEHTFHGFPFAYIDEGKPESMELSAKMFSGRYVNALFDKSLKYNAFRTDGILFFFLTKQLVSRDPGIEWHSMKIACCHSNSFFFENYDQKNVFEKNGKMHTYNQVL